MENIVKLLSMEYDNKRREINEGSGNISNTCSENKVKINILLLLTGMVIGLGIFGLNSIKKNINNFFWLGIALYIICFICLIKYTDKQLVISSQENRKKYYKNLNILKNIIHEDFHIYSESKVKQLINECDKELELLNSKNRLMKKFKELWKIIFAPALGFVSAMIISIENLSKYLNWSIVISMTIQIALIISSILGVLWAAENFASMIYKDEKKRVIELKAHLNDLYLKNYM